MNLNCDVVMDLVALYHDGEASKASEAAVRAHLKECSRCRAHYGEYGISVPAVETFHFSAKGDYSRLAKQMRIRRLWIYVSVLLYVSASLVALIMLLMKMKKNAFQFLSN